MIRNKTKKVACFASLCFALTQVAGCGGNTEIAASQATCEAFLQKMRTHQYASARDFLTLAGQSVGSSKQLQDEWERVEKKRGNVQSWEHQGSDFHRGLDGNNVKIAYILKSSKGTSSASLICMAQGNSWLIYNFNFSG